MSMRAKIILLMVVPIVVLWGVGMFIYFQMNNVGTKVHSIVDIYSQALITSKDIHIAALRVEENVFSYIATKSSEDKSKLTQSISYLKTNVDKLSALSLGEFSKNLKTMQASISSLETQASVIDQAVHNGNKNITVEENKMTSLANQIVATAADMAKIAENNIKNVGNDTKSSVKTVLLLQLYVPLAVLVISIIVALLIVRAMLINLKPLMEAARKLQNNDLTFEFKVHDGRDEISQLFEAFRNATLRLKENMKNIHQSAREASKEMDNTAEAVESVSQGMNEATIAVTDIAKKMQDVSAATEEVTASAEEMASTIKSVADNSQEASQFGEESAKLAKEGGKSIEEVINSMKDISNVVKDIQRVVENFNVGAKEISNFVTTVTTIAEQTNLLALNASIEAARAGEAGKGFAVVADEIRSLAEDSKQAAAKVEKVVDSVNAVAEDSLKVSEKIKVSTEKGSKLSDEAREKLKEIILRIDKITQMMERIAAAAQEQTASMDEVAKAMTSNAQTATDVSASTEEISASAQETNASAEEMATAIKNVKEKVEKIVNTYKL